MIERGTFSAMIATGEDSKEKDIETDNGSNALTEENSKAEKENASPKKEGLGLLVGLFNDQKLWDKHQTIREALQKKGCEISLATVSRWLKALGAKNNDTGQWFLDQDHAHKENLKALRGLFDNTQVQDSDFSTRVRTAVLKTKRHYNLLIAEKIRQTFPKEVLSTFCPNEDDIIIYYRKLKKDDSGKELKSELEAEIRESCKTQKGRKAQNKAVQL
jgi:arginine repressor